MSGCFGSVAASRYFTTWAAAYGQKQTVAGSFASALEASVLTPLKDIVVAINVYTQLVVGNALNIENPAPRLALRANTEAFSDQLRTTSFVDS